jgi:hypothetical protein
LFRPLYHGELDRADSEFPQLTKTYEQATLRHVSSDMKNAQRLAAALMCSRLRAIDHEGRHFIEEVPKNLLRLFRQCSFLKSAIHQAHPSIAGSPVYLERRMPRPQAWMASLFDVSLRSPEPTD